MPHPAKLCFSQPERHFPSFWVWGLSKAKNARALPYALGQSLKFGQFGIDRLNVRSPRSMVVPRGIPM
jgi:hypothetical protein